VTTAPDKPKTDDPVEDDDTKYRLLRTPGQKGVLPEAGQRRFSKYFAQRALSLDHSFDAVECRDLGDWDDRDVWCEENWVAWAGPV
jgi:hypothetical protein